MQLGTSAYSRLPGVALMGLALTGAVAPAIGIVLASLSLAHADTGELTKLAESAARYAASHSLAPGDPDSLASMVERCGAISDGCITCSGTGADFFCSPLPIACVRRRFECAGGTADKVPVPD